MNADDQPFAQWLAGLVAEAGYDRHGGKAALAKAAGLSPTQVGRALSGEATPDVGSQAGLTRALRDAGIDVTLREMLIRSGLVTPDDLPAADAPPPPPVSEIDLHGVARRFGVPHDKIELFVRVVETTAQTFADDTKAGTVTPHTRAGGRAVEGE